jgi:protein SFI1
MRSRMKVVRLNREKKLKNDAWAKWRQLYQSRLSAQHYSSYLLTRFFSRWRRRLAGVDEVEDAGENLALTFDNRRMSKFWDIWRRTSALRATESLLVERVNLRVMNDAVAVWKKRMWVIGFGFVWARRISQSPQAEHCHRGRIQQ